MFPSARPAGRSRLDPQPRPRTSTRSASSARPSISRRAGRSGSIEDGGKIEQETRLFRSRRGRDAVDAQQGRSARLPLFPRSGSAAAWNFRKIMSMSLRRHPAGAAGRAQGALYAAITSFPCVSDLPDRLTQTSRPLAQIILKEVAKGRDAKAAANWVINDMACGSKSGRPGRSRRFWSQPSSLVRS